MSPESARRLLREVSLELARLRRIRGASHKTWRRIARARRRLAFAAALLATPLVAEPAAASDPLFAHHGLPLGVPAIPLQIGYGSQLAFVDIDGDGDVDLFVGASTGNTYFLRNTGSVTQAALAPPQTNSFGLADVGSGAVPSFADLDDDGDQDALVGSSNQSWLFQNTGNAASPAFAAPVINPFGLTTRVTELADLDGDGDVDASRPSTGGVTVWYENTGSAAAPAFAAAVTSPFGLAAGVAGFADLDGDGDLDGFNGTGDFSYQLAFFENTGAATAPGFAAPVNAFGPNFLNQTIADFADLDGDGDLDGLALGMAVERIVSLWVENVGSPGAPAFTNLGNPFGLGSRLDPYALAGYAYPSDGASCSLADFDGDGDLDAFLGPDEFEDNVGAPNAPAFVPVPVETLALSGNEPVLADLDADGDPDGLVGIASGEVLFFENTGSASEPAFAMPLASPFGLADVGAYAAPDLADLDGDGDLDVLVGNAAGDFWLFENTGGAASPAFAIALTNPAGLSNLAGYASPVFADLDGDGDLDVMVGAFTGNLFWFANTGTAASPAFAGPTPYAFGLTDVGTYASPDFADIDGDGDLDGFVGSAGSYVSFFRNTGTAGAPAFASRTFSAPGIGTLHTGATFPAPELADLDDDGDLDAVVGSLQGTIAYFPNAGTPTTPRLVRPSFANPFGIAVREPELVDLDADGDLDLFSGTSWYENTGSAIAPGFGALVSQPFGLASVGLAVAASAFVDVDADGDRDALIGKNDGSLVFFANTGSTGAPAFAAPSTNPFGLADVGTYATPDLADLDGDGDLDALIGAYDGNTRLFENTGSATSPAFAPALVNPFGLVDVGFRSSPEIADVDTDGDLDVVVSDLFRRLVFFENVLIDEGACADAVDNDGDGRIDVGPDAGCANAADTSELSALQCDNGLDDDADGKIDWRGDGTGDPHCSGLLDDRELPPQPAGPSCGLGPELLLLGPLLAARRRRSEVTDA